MVDVVFTLADGFHHGGAANGGFFTNGAKAFGEDDQFVARDVIFEDGAADDRFGNTTRVNVCGIPLYVFSGCAMDLMFMGFERRVV